MKIVKKEHFFSIVIRPGSRDHLTTHFPLHINIYQYCYIHRCLLAFYFANTPIPVDVQLALSMTDVEIATYRHLNFQSFLIKMFRRYDFVNYNTKNFLR